MEGQLETPEMIQRLKKLAVRAWWADGLWDFATALLLGLMAVYFYYFTTIFAFENAPWPWPLTVFQSQMALEPFILAMSLAFLLFAALALYLTYLLVKALKSWLVAPVTGNVRHSFWLPMDSKVMLLYLGLYVVSSVLLVMANQAILGDWHLYSVYLITAPAAIFFAIGTGYWLKRYVVFSILGTVICLVVEWCFTTPVNPGGVPLNFFNVSPSLGNPAIPLTVWCAVMLASGVTGLVLTLKGLHE